MSETLYRKHRPQTFAEVIGQAPIVTTLQNQLQGGKISHAYLFCGIRGVGKTTVARLLAKAVNCERRKPGSSEACGECESCIAVATGRSLDVIELDAASNRRIDDVRELREMIPVGPAHSRYKVVIVDEVHMLTTEAFNALLKTLEEPPAHVIFILATTEVHKVPDTILSRCQRFDFRRLPAADVVTRLETLAKAEGVTVAAEVLKEVAYLSSGSARDAESYLGKLVSLGEKRITQETASLVLPHSDLKTTLTFMEQVTERHTGEALALLNRFLEEGGELMAFHRQVLELLRKMLLVKLGGKLGSYASLELTPPDEARLEALAQHVSTHRLQGMLATWLEAGQERRASDIFQLPLELATVAMGEEAPELSSLPRGTSAVSHPAASPTVSAVKPSADTGKLTLAQVALQWNQVVAKLRDFNHSLSFILSIAKPSHLEGKTLTITFQYKLHQERVNDPKVRAAIEQVLDDVLQTKLAIRAVVEEVAAGTGDLLASVLGTFGGQVVD